MFYQVRIGRFHAVNGGDHNVVDAIVEHELSLRSRGNDQERQKKNSYAEAHACKKTFADPGKCRGPSGSPLPIRIEISYPVLRILLLDPETLADTQLEIRQPPLARGVSADFVSAASLQVIGENSNLIA